MQSGLDEDEVPRFVRGLPKAEVHVHLEGCVPAALASKAASLRGSSSPVPTIGGKPQIGDLQALLDYLDWSCSLIDDRAQLEAIAYATSVRLHESGALYGDVIFNPSHWPHWRRRVGEMVNGLSAGISAAEADGYVPVGLCLSLKRQQSRSEANELVDWMIGARPERLVALSIDGNEAGGSHNERFAEAFALAAKAGFRRCAHAGESSGPEGVREAVEMLGAERIDHGIRSLEDESVVAELVRRDVPLDICPTSNIVLGIVGSIADHPFQRLRQAGVKVSVNTDDPVLYGIELAGEYELVAKAFSLGAEELVHVARVSIESCFADAEKKEAMLGQLDAYVREWSGD